LRTGELFEITFAHGAPIPFCGPSGAIQSKKHTSQRADLPVQQCTKVNMIIKPKSAKDLEIIVPFALRGPW
jgi:hypothetical protein